MKSSEFDYELPHDLIAQEPASPRDSCRLMVLNRADRKITHRRFFELPDILRKGDVLVFNDSKVLPARIVFSHEGKEVEIFLTRRVSDAKWLAIGRPGKMPKPGVRFDIRGILNAEIEKILDDGQRLVRFSRSGRDFDEVLWKIGCAPLPPYIKKSHAPFEDYQTVYARSEGSVAAPTAGLHFTKELMDTLSAAGIQMEFVTLHVGLGTFLPLKTDVIEEHVMHSELFNLNEETAERLGKAKKEGRRLIAVGTTSVRVLEACHDESGGFRAGYGETALYIYPGYRWRCVDALMTNFHLPKSTLLLLTCAFGGKDFVFKAYREAIEQRYRFYSFGDAMLIQ